MPSKKLTNRFPGGKTVDEYLRWLGLPPQNFSKSIKDEWIYRMRYLWTKGSHTDVLYDVINDANIRD